MSDRYVGLERRMRNAKLQAKYWNGEADRLYQLYLARKYPGCGFSGRVPETHAENDDD